MILQTNQDGFYVSELIEERYQILQSTILKEQYTIYDHTKQDNIKDNDATRYFPSIESAMAYITKTPIKKRRSVIKTRTRRMFKETALSYMRNLLTETSLTDEEIADKIKERFPDSTYNKYMVKFQRKKVTEEVTNANS